MTTRLILVSHAATAATRSAAFPADEPVDPAGLKRLPATLPRADRIWTSPALCARQTAVALGLDATVEPLLRECGYGRWTGRGLEDVHAREPDALARWMADPAAAPHGGESLVTLLARVAGWLDGQNSLSGRVTVITHASIIRAAIVHAIGAAPGSFWRIDMAPLALCRLSGADGRWNLTAIGAASPPQD